MDVCSVQVNMGLMPFGALIGRSMRMSAASLAGIVPPCGLLPREDDE